MHVLRVVRVLLPVLIVAAIVGAGSSVLSARPDLQKAKRSVDSSWTTLSKQLDTRYAALSALDDNLRPVPGPMHTLVNDLDAALARWRDARAHSALAAQVGAANDVEALARRLLRTEAVSPRVRNNAKILTAVAKFLADPSRDAANVFNQRVASYEHERHGPVRAVVASVLGDGSIPVLDTTSTTVSQQGVGSAATSA
jgi:ribosomal protein L18E